MGQFLSSPLPVKTQKFLLSGSKHIINTVERERTKRNTMVVFLTSRGQQVLLFVVVVLATICQAQKVSKSVKQKAKNCYPDVNGAKLNDTVTVHYTGKLSDGGKQFDSSIGGQPISFRLGAGIVIKGWEDGLLGSCKGEKAILKIPSQLGYGAKGAGDAIPPNADLEFEIELVDIKHEYHEEYLVTQSCTTKQKSRDQDFVDFTYIGRVPNGTVFGEAGVETGGPIHIEVGRTGLKGWDKALAGMCKGDKKRAFLPPDLAYGSEGLKECGKDEECPYLVEPNSVVDIEIEMVDIQDRVLSFLFKTSAGTAFSGR